MNLSLSFAHNSLRTDDVLLLRKNEHTLIIIITLKVTMRLVALATALAFILVVFLNSPPYTDALYVADDEGIQIEHGHPGDRS